MTSDKGRDVTHMQEIFTSIVIPALQNTIYVQHSALINSHFKSPSPALSPFCTSDNGGISTCVIAGIRGKWEY